MALSLTSRSQTHHCRQPDGHSAKMARDKSARARANRELGLERVCVDDGWARLACLLVWVWGMRLLADGISHVGRQASGQQPDQQADQQAAQAGAVRYEYERSGVHHRHPACAYVSFSSGRVLIPGLPRPKESAGQLHPFREEGEAKPGAFQGTGSQLAGPGQLTKCRLVRREAQASGQFAATPPFHRTSIRQQSCSIGKRAAALRRRLLRACMEIRRRPHTLDQTPSQAGPCLSCAPLLGLDARPVACPVHLLAQIDGLLRSTVFALLITVEIRSLGLTSAKPPQSRHRLGLAWRTHCSYCSPPPAAGDRSCP